MSWSASAAWMVGANGRPITATLSPMSLMTGSWVADWTVTMNVVLPVSTPAAPRPSPLSVAETVSV